jgi:hypothetical protein
MPTGGISSADLCSCRFVGEKRQRRFFDEHGLDAGLSRPGRKIHPGDTLTKRRWFRHVGAVLESAAPTKSAKSAESAAGAGDESGWAG